MNEGKQNEADKRPQRSKEEDDAVPNLFDRPPDDVQHGKKNGAYVGHGEGVRVDGRDAAAGGIEATTCST
jgi:hypothetical protein